ncbi:MAG: response regulator [Bacteroidales bacterium]|nr:response regulator [Bacteroidales bacterium]
MSTEGKSENPILGIVRILFLSKFLVILLALFLALFFGIRSSNQLLRAIQGLSEPNRNLDIIESGINHLFRADNNFRIFVISGDSANLNAYKSNLNAVAGVIDSLETTYSSYPELNNANRNLELHNQAAARFLNLRTLTDSLLNATSKLDSFPINSIPGSQYSIERFKAYTQEILTDTILISNGHNHKKGFINKVKSLFQEDKIENKTDTKVSHSRKNYESESSIELSNTEYRFLNDIRKFYQLQLQQMAVGKRKLGLQESELINSNSRILENLQILFETSRTEEIELTSTYKTEARKEARRASHWLVGIAGFTLLLASTMFFMILRSLNKVKLYSMGLQRSKEASEKLAVQKSNFLTSMSHEIRAPLNNIIGFAEQLSNESLSTEEKNLLDGISSSSDLLLSTVNQILDFSTLESGKMTFKSHNFNPFKVINEVVSTNQLRASHKKLVIKNQFKVDDSILLKGDAFRLKQVISNLVDNAIKYSDSGEIKVIANLEMVNEDKGRLIVSVEDQGIGIPSDQLSNIFVEFSRIDDASMRPWQAGTGLGLPICKRIVEQQFGHLAVKSEVGKGSTFSFSIPYLIGNKSVARKEAKIIKEDLSKLNGKNVLLAEDDEFSRILVSRILLKHGVILEMAADGIEAFNMIEEGRFDIILTDVNMPGMDGFELVSKIRAFEDRSKAGVPVLAVTANVMEPELRQIMESGMNGYILKPFRENELLSKIVESI